MGRDDTDTCVKVPSVFRCPISLDVMRSPVSLCTGITYDRASIQRWLDGGNNTCPATMQVLHSRELVPNRTLQRLIEAWSDSVRRHGIGSPAPATGVPTQEEVKNALGKLNLEKDDCFRLEMLSRIVKFARESEENREFLARKPDFVPMLVDFMAAFDAGIAKNTKMELVFRAIRILDTIRCSIAVDQERLSNLMLTSGRDCLKAILLALQRGNLESKIESVRVLESVAIAAESKLTIAQRDGMLPELIKSISAESDPSLIEASLSCLIAISTSKRVRSRLIAAKTITKLKDLLLMETMNGGVGVTEKALKLLETLSSRREGRSEIIGEDGECVRGVVRKLLKVSTAATEHAVAILWCVCYVFREEKAKEAVEKSNGVTKILVVMQSNCSQAVRQMTKDLLKVFKVNSSSRFIGYNTKTTHIMPF